MIDLTPVQRKTVALGVTVLAFSVIAAFALLLVWSAASLLNAAAPALAPVLMGLFLALFFKPYYEWCRRLVRNPTLALLAMLTSVLVPVGFIVWFAGAAVIEQVANFITAAPTLVTRISQWVQANHPGIERGLRQIDASPDVLMFFSDPVQFSHVVIAQLQSLYGGAAVKVGFGAVKCAFGLLSWLVAFVFFVCFLMKPQVKGADLARHLAFCKQETRRFLAEQVDSFADVMVSFFQRQVVICIVEGILYGAGFALVGAPYGFLLGFGLGILNLVPFLGTVVFLPVALLLAYFGDGGSVLRLLGVAGVWAAGQVADNYCITPLIQGGRTGLGFAGVIFSFLFWGTVFHSLMGLLLAIPLSAFCLVLWRAVKKRYVRAVI